MAEVGAAAGVRRPGPPAGDPPGGDRAALAVFLVREAVAVLFVLLWLLLLWADVVVQGYRLPFWLNCVGVAVLAYALGLNVADLTSTRLPGPLRR